MARTQQEIECPKCGCKDLAELRDRFSEAFVYQCRHCRTSFDPPPEFVDLDSREPLAIFQTTRCVHCNSPDTRVTRGPVGPRRKRQHFCNNCELPFSSRELG